MIVDDGEDFGGELAAPPAPQNGTGRVHRAGDAGNPWAPAGEAEAIARLHPARLERGDYALLLRRKRFVRDWTIAELELAELEADQRAEDRRRRGDTTELDRRVEAWEADRRASLEREAAADIEPPRRRWIVPLADLLGDGEPDEDDSADWIRRDVVPRGEPALLAGPPKAGKTWVALDLAIAIALGAPFLSEEPMTEPARVLVLALEDNERRLRRRVWELARGRGLTPNDPTLRSHLSITRTPVRIPDAGDLRAFRDELKAWRPTVVAIDNATRVFQGDPNSTRDAAAFTAAWAGLCVDIGAAVLLIHHTRKQNGERGARESDPFDTVRGSGDLVAAARHVMIMRPIGDPETDQPRALSELLARGNLDVRRPSRALELVRERQADGRTTARVVDRGDASAVRQVVADDRKAARDEGKRAEVAREFERRRQLAIDLANRNGLVTQAEVATAVGLKSPRAVAGVFESLVTAEILELSKTRGGYVIRGSR